MTSDQLNEENSERTVVLTIAGLDPSGGAGVIADIKTFLAFDCFPTAAVTSITFQNTTGVFGAVPQTGSTVRSQVEPLCNDFEIKAVKTGMLPTVEVVHTVVELVRERKLPAPVVDPVMTSTSGHQLTAKDAFTALRTELIPLAVVVTPNIPEAEQLTGNSIRSISDMKRAAELIMRSGAQAVLVKGGHLENPGEGKLISHRVMTDVLLTGDGDFFEYTEEVIEVGELHGTGCVLSAAIAASLAKGESLVDAVRLAKMHVTKAIRSASKLGHGARPL